MYDQPVGKFLYRIHDTGSELGKAFDYTFCNTSETYCYRYKIISTTNCGAWVERDGGKKFVMLEAHKKFACETIPLAVESFKARKTRQLRILKAQIDRILEARATVDSAKFEREEYYQKELTNLLRV